MMHPSETYDYCFYDKLMKITRGNGRHYVKLNIYASELTLVPGRRRKPLILCLFCLIWIKNFAKGNLAVSLSSRTAITELIQLWYEYLVVARFHPL